MAKAINRRPVRDTYLTQVKQFPLRSIADDDELKEAQRVLDALLGEKLDEGAEEYLDVLTDLVEKYEDAAHPIPDAPPQDVLGLLMESNGVKQTELAKATGVAQSTISALRAGNRPFTPEHMVALGRFFKVTPAVFLPQE